MLGKLCGVIALIMKDDDYQIFLPFHCVIHRRHFAAKYFKYDHIMKTVLDIVSLFCFSAKTIASSEMFVEELDEDIPKDANYYCIVRWLSTSNVLKRFMDLFEPICTFFEENRRFANNWLTLNGNRT